MKHEDDTDRNSESGEDSTRRPSSSVADESEDTRRGTGRHPDLGSLFLQPRQPSHQDWTEDMTDPDERDPLDFEDTSDRAALLKQLAVEERDLFRNATTLAVVFPALRVCTAASTDAGSTVQQEQDDRIKSSAQTLRTMIKATASAYLPRPYTAGTDAEVIGLAVNCLNSFAEGTPQTARDGVFSRLDAPNAAQVKGLEMLAGRRAGTSVVDSAVAGSAGSVDG